MMNLGSGVFYSWWYLWIDLTMNKVTLLQILQCLREHLLGTVRHQPTDFIEAQYTRHSRPLVAYPLPFAGVKHIENQHRPLVTETTHYLPDRTG